MNKKAKKRLVMSGFIVVMAMIVVVALLGSQSTSQALEVGQAASGQFEGQKVQVAGKVVKDSFSAQGTDAVFLVTGEEGAADTTTQLKIIYTGALPATFGNDITAICTGTIQGGVLHAHEMVTKCPSKYESAQGALTVANLLGQKDSMQGVSTKLAGYIVTGSLVDVSQEGPRFSVESQGAQIAVSYAGALSQEYQDGTAVVITGSLQADGTFEATDIAIDNAVDHPTAHPEA